MSHFEDDHMGAARVIARIVNFVDHGENVTYEKPDAWWKGRRGPWFREGMNKIEGRNSDEFRQARTQSNHIAVKAGGKVPMQQNIQMELGFSSMSAREAREAGREETESLAATHGSQSPASTPCSRSADVTTRTAVYGPVRTAVWRGSAGNRRPYAD